jgi:hypothetical protein
MFSVTDGQSCRVLALLRHVDRLWRCPLPGEDRKSSGEGQTDAIDPKPSLRYGRASAPGLHKKLIDQERVGVG